MFPFTTAACFLTWRQILVPLCAGPYRLIRADRIGTYDRKVPPFDQFIASLRPPYALIDCPKHLLFCLNAPFILVYQATRLAVLFGPAIPIGIGCDVIKHPRIFYQYLKWALQTAGPTFIKLGQWASTRPDLLPWELCQILSGLQSGVHPHHQSWNEQIISKVFGKSIAEEFDYFSPTPVGSGTVGQVHKATFQGRTVAVKIVHPGIRERVERELLTIRFLAWCLHQSLPSLHWMDFQNQAELFGTMMRQQLDLRQEAFTLSRFRRNFSPRRPIRSYSKSSSQVLFAQPLVSTPDVLIETWCSGLSLQQFMDKETNVHRRRAIAMSGFAAFMQMLLWDNFIHADLHPGNLKVSNPTADNENISLIILDTGLTIELDSRDHDNLADLFNALFLDKSAEEAAQLILSRRSQPFLTNPDAFIAEFSQVFHDILQEVSSPTMMIKGKDLRTLEVGSTLLEAFQVARKHHVQLEPSFSRVISSLMVIEGVGRQLAPDLPVMPLLRQAAIQFIVSETARRLTQRVQPLL